MKIRKREPLYAGSFYPGQRETAEQMLDGFFRDNKTAHRCTHKVRALIVPHAGYVFSGPVAAAAYREVLGASYKRVFLLGASHRYQFPGVAASSMDAFEIPGASCALDTLICSRLNDTPGFREHEASHQEEHSLEVQLPFLKYALPGAPALVPILFGSMEQETIKKAVSELKTYWTEDNLFIISTDFSHYLSQDDAGRVDTASAEAISSGNPETVMQTLNLWETKGIPGLVTAACGKGPLLCLLYIMKEKGYRKIQHIMYRNSGDAGYGDRNQVVGYHSFFVC